MFGHTRNHGNPSFLRTALLATALAACGTTTLTQAAVLSTYNFTGQTNGQKTTIPVNSSGANVTGSDITKSSVLMSVDTNAGLWASAPFLGISTDTTLAGAPYTTAAAAITANSYFTFTLTAGSGYELDLTSLTFVATKGGGSVRGFAIQTSATGFSTNGSTNINTGTANGSNANQNISGTGVVSSGFSTTLSTSRTTAYSTVNISLTDAAYQNLSSITFRVFTFAASNFQTVEFDDIVINGTASAVPEPATLALLGLGGLLMTFKRKARA